MDVQAGPDGGDAARGRRQGAPRATAARGGAAAQGAGGAGAPRAREGEGREGAEGGCGARAARAGAARTGARSEGEGAARDGADGPREDDPAEAQREHEDVGERGAAGPVAAAQRQRHRHVADQGGAEARGGDDDAHERRQRPAVPPVGRGRAAPLPGRPAPGPHDASPAHVPHDADGPAAHVALPARRARLADARRPLPGPRVPHGPDAAAAVRVGHRHISRRRGGAQQGHLRRPLGRPPARQGAEPDPGAAAPPHEPELDEAVAVAHGRRTERTPGLRGPPQEGGEPDGAMIGRQEPPDDQVNRQTRKMYSKYIQRKRKIST